MQIISSLKIWLLSVNFRNSPLQPNTVWYLECCDWSPFCQYASYAMWQFWTYANHTWVCDRTAPWKVLVYVYTSRLMYLRSDGHGQPHSRDGPSQLKALLTWRPISPNAPLAWRPFSPEGTFTWRSLSPEGTSQLKAPLTWRYLSPEGPSHLNHRGKPFSPDGPFHLNPFSPVDPLHLKAPVT